MSSLFRHEALESHRNQWLGGIRLIRPVSLGVLTLLALAAAIAVITFLALGGYTRKARVSGYLVPDRGVIRLVSPQVATVLESHVAEGQAVRQGDVLYVLSIDSANVSDNVRATLSARERSLQGAARQQDDLDRGRAEAIDRQVDAMRTELQQIEGESRLHAQRLVLAEASLARLESLRGDNFVSAAQVQTKNEEVLGLRVQEQALQRQRTAHQREIDQLLARRRELPIQGQVRQGEIERDRAELAQLQAENLARQRIELRAPQDGIVTGVVAQPGQAVSPVAALASLLPADARLQAHLFAPSSALGFVHEQQPVLLRYQAFPYQKFGLQGGQVSQISRVPLQTTELAGLPLPTAASLAEPLYRITVTLDRQAVAAHGQDQALAPGMQLDADILLERRRLIEWIFEPLLGVAGRV
jgi:membrane fusion protein